ncbi:TetR/AcrR family transcriptional regulator [Baekduia sp.]|jgi:AcrR family transcriptional regulator|uniref:TetR/AcrR family transcriptional regulator n=1 Tax=Baekduia sp. TaxID=2600305 RepID=UPI002E015A66|nr:TetR/AcrR family transcriptional regulator [Baekduia sp.]
MAADESRTTSPVAHREGPATAKRAQIQAEVLRATEQLLAEGSSYADLNVERIATAAGISRTAFYFYFRDKRDLLMRLAGDVTELLYAQADIWFSGEGDDPEQEIREALTRIAELYREHGVLIRAIVEVSTYEEDIATFWRGLLSRFVDATARRIEIEDQLPEGTAYATAFALTWMVERTFYQQLVQDEPLPQAEMVDAVVRIYRGTVYGLRA